LILAALSAGWEGVGGGRPVSQKTCLKGRNHPGKGRLLE